VNRASSARPARVLVIHNSYPLFDRSGADSRLFQILKTLREQGHVVTYLARSGYGRDEYAAHLERAGIQVFANDAERLRWSGQDLPVEWNLETLLREGDFDVAILSHWFWSGKSVAEDYLDDIQHLSPRTLVAVLTDDFHGLRERRSAELSGLPCDWERSVDFEQREFEVYRRADLVLTISDHDRDLLMARDPSLNIERLPMAAQIADPGPGFAPRSGLLFLANFANPASSEGMRWFLAEVWPQIKHEIPSVILFLAGNNAPADIVFPGSNIECLGHVPDLDPVFARCRVFISPIRFGTGIKTKNVIALAHGLPLVTTTAGAEGMNLRDGETALIADNPADIARAVVCAYADEDLWKRLSVYGRELVQREFSLQQLKVRLAELTGRSRGFNRTRPAESKHLSFCRVETEYPEVLTYLPGEERIGLRIERYLRLAEKFLAEQRPVPAREQLRHIFSLVKGPVPQAPVFSHIFAALDRCYRELGEKKPYEDKTS
jgi:O-antigen biosynthesis protein